VNGLTVAVAALLRWLNTFLPADRQDWVEAVGAEAADVPSGWSRLRWYVGGLRVVASETALIRLATYTLLGVAVAAVQVWPNWGSGAAGPGVAVNRGAHVAMMATVVALPWVVRRRLGPVASSPSARIIRAGGLVALYLLLLALAGVSHKANARFDGDTNPGIAGVVFNGVVITILAGSWVYGVLALTSTRHSVPRRALMTGVAVGAAIAGMVYALMPTGHLIVDNPATVAVVVFAPPAAVLLSSALARHVGLGMLIGLTAGGAAALLAAVLTVPTMLAFPHSVALEWANPDANVPHGTPYEWQMSLGDAANEYVLAMVYAPILGLVLGAIGSGRTDRRHPRRPASVDSTSS
jgi:hypothetical protein